MTNATTVIRDGSYVRPATTDDYILRHQSKQQRLAYLDIIIKNRKFEITNIKKAIRKNPAQINAKLETKLSQLATLVDRLRTEKEYLAQMPSNDYHRPIKSKPKKLKDSVIDQLIENFLQDNTTVTSITAEEMAFRFNTYIHIVKQALHRLNLKGIVSQAHNRQHTDFEWIASSYDVLK